MAEKNFRSNYYEKMGFKAVDVKKSMENVLTEDVVDKTKLAQFVIKYDLPAQYRLPVWKILLNISSCNKEATDFVCQQRLEQYQVLLKALRTMRYLPATDNGSNDDDESGLRIKLASILALEENRLPWPECSDNAFAAASHVANSRRRSSVKEWWWDGDFDVVFGLVHDLLPTEDEVKMYWLCRNLCKLMTQRKTSVRAQMKEVETYVMKNDAGLGVHLEKGGVWKWPPASPILSDLLRFAFANVFRCEAVLRLWDKVVAGCAMSEVFVLAELMLLHRSSLMATPVSLVLDKLDWIIREVPVMNQHAIIDRALETWRMDFGGIMQPNLSAPVAAASFATSTNPAGQVTALPAPTEAKQKIAGNPSISVKSVMQRKLSQTLKL